MAIPFRIKEDSEEKEQVKNLSEKVVVTPEPVAETVNEEVVEEQSFVTRLLQELVGVYLRLSSSGRRNSDGVRRRRQRIMSENGVPFSQITTSSTILPDLIRCHIQPQSHQNDVPTTTSFHAPERNNSHQNTEDSNPGLTNVFQTLIEDEEDFNSELDLDIKMTFDFSYQRIGQDLKRIADTFDSSSLTHRRRRHPAGNSDQENKEICLKLEFALTFLIPAAVCLVLFKSGKVSVLSFVKSFLCK